ncbi:hypothetical protein [Streptomyces sp. NPDC047061]|uniref:hypothetical protein n=1 Tax=Streptomyces sp. NPDC047061 TaxID=3154605 RepID=UPI0033EFA576
MNGGDTGIDEARGRRVRHPVVLAVVIGGYVLAAIAGLFVLAGDFGSVLLVPLWIVHAVVLVVLVRKLGARTCVVWCPAGSVVEVAWMVGGGGAVRSAVALSFGFPLRSVGCSPENPRHTVTLVLCVSRGGRAGRCSRG